MQFSPWYLCVPNWIWATRRQPAMIKIFLGRSSPRGSSLCPSIRAMVNYTGSNQKWTDEEAFSPSHRRSTRMRNYGKWSVHCRGAHYTKLSFCEDNYFKTNSVTLKSQMAPLRCDWINLHKSKKSEKISHFWSNLFESFQDLNTIVFA